MAIEKKLGALLGLIQVHGEKVETLEQILMSKNMLETQEKTQSKKSLRKASSTRNRKSPCVNITSMLKSDFFN